MCATFTRGLLALSLAIATVASGCGGSAPPTTPQPTPKPGIVRARSQVACDLYASTRGSDSAPGSRARPFRTAERLVNSLHRGQTGCFRGGIYPFSLLLLKTPEVTLAPFGHEAVALRGEIKVLPDGAGSTIEGLELDGRGVANIGPRIYANNVVLRDNDITNQHTGICILISQFYSHPLPNGVVIEGNRIHDCGREPSTNHDHGIYVDRARGTVIRDNWIYDNTDRGIQLYPDAQSTRIVGNVIDGNGDGIAFGGVGTLTSNNNIVVDNVISDSTLGWNVYSGRTGPRATGNVLRDNCLWAGESGAAFKSDGGIQDPSRNFTATGNVVADPSYSDPGDDDLTLSPESHCPLVRQANRPAFGGPR
jgi:hypothetical protein